MEINPAAVLALISNLYAQLAENQAETVRLKGENESLKRVLSGSAPVQRIEDLKVPENAA